MKVKMFCLVSIFFFIYVKSWKLLQIYDLFFLDDEERLRNSSSSLNPAIVVVVVVVVVAPFMNCSWENN